MTRWDLTVGDRSQTFLIATLDERHVTAGGDTRAPSLLLPLGWEEILPNGARHDASGRVIAVSFDLHIDQAPNRYWLRTGLQPVSRAQTPTLPLQHSIAEALSIIAQMNPDGDVALNISIQALAMEQGSPANVRTHWHQNPQTVHIGVTQWQAMLKQWGYPAVRLVSLNLQLPAKVGEHNKVASDLWTAACERLKAAQQEWAAGDAGGAGEELRHVVQLAIRTWGAVWYPNNPPGERDDWRDIARRLGSDIEGCDTQSWTIGPESTADAQRAFAFLMLLRNLNAMANPFHHVGASAVYTRADVDMLVTVSTAVARGLPEFWRQFPAPQRGET